MYDVLRGNEVWPCGQTKARVKASLHEYKDASQRVRLTESSLITYSGVGSDCEKQMIPVVWMGCL